MLKKLLIAISVSTVSFVGVNSAVAAHSEKTLRAPLSDRIYCIRDFRTGRLMCLSVPDPKPGNA
jgi:hypothetical protein